MLNPFDKHVVPDFNKFDLLGKKLNEQTTLNVSEKIVSISR